MGGVSFAFPKTNRAPSKNDTPASGFRMGGGKLLGPQPNSRPSRATRAWLSPMDPTRESRALPPKRIASHDAFVRLRVQV